MLFAFFFSDMTSVCDYMNAQRNVLFCHAFSH